MAKASKARSAGGANAGKKNARSSAVKREHSAGSVRSDDGQPPEELLCGICYDLLNGATQTPCCGALSCRECIEEAAVRASSCPYCRAESLTTDRLHPDVRIERLAAAFLRHCSHAGCSFRGNRDDIKVHAGTCGQRPMADVLAELQDTDLRWRKQRCWHLSSLVCHGGALDRDSDFHRQFEFLMCRVHAFIAEAPGGTSEPRLDRSVGHPGANGSMAMIPQTEMEVHGNVGAPCVRVSHVQDQVSPTACFIIKRADPKSARRILIPAKAAEAVVVRGWLSADEYRGLVKDAVGDGDGSGVDDIGGEGGEDDQEDVNDDSVANDSGSAGNSSESRRGLMVFLAKTLAHFGLTESREYADDRVAKY